jgi:predicted transcriptional regulator
VNEADVALRILAVIQRHTIKDPITISQLAEMFGLQERGVKSYLKMLIDNGHKVGSNKSAPLGVFIARYPEEMRETAERLHREGVKMIAKAHRLMDYGNKELTIFEQPLEAV